MNTLALDPEQLQCIKKILKNHLPAVKVVVFGSRSTGKIKPHSDLDLCIMAKKPLSFSQLSDLREDFSESDLPFRVDIVEWSELSPPFKRIIKEHAIELY